MRVYMKLRNETKGALRYDEVRRDGFTVLTVQEGAPVGSMYMRKSAYPDGKYPERLIIEITEEPAQGIAEIPHG